MNPSDLARYVGAAPTWLKQYRVSGTVTNPAALTIITETGAMEGGYYDVFWFVGAGMALPYNGILFAWRNAANTAYLWGEYYTQAAAGNHQGLLLGIQVLSSERFWILNEPALVGSATGAIIAVRRI